MSDMYLGRMVVSKRAGPTSAGSFHAALWLIVVVLGASLLAYPRAMALHYSPVQAVDVIRPLARFGVLYYAWIATLLLLLCIPQPLRNLKWRCLLISVLFALVYRGFWDVVFASVKNADAVLNAATAEQIRSLGRVPSPVDFRGLQILVALVSTTSGIPLADGVRIVMLLIDGLLGGAFFLFSLCLLRDPRWAVISAILGMEGNILFPRLLFYPGILGFVFVSLFLSFALRRFHEVLQSSSGAILSFVVLAGNAVTHFVTSMLIFSLVLWMWLVTLARRELKQRDCGGLASFAYGMVPIAWLSFAAVQTFRSLAILAGQLPENLQGESFLRAVLLAGQANYGAGVPVWASAIRAFWVFLLLGLGAVIAFSRFLRLRTAPQTEARATGAFLGIVFLGAVNTAISSGGFEFVRFPLYVPLVTAPLLLLAVVRLPNALRTIGLATIAVCIVALSLPTFLVGSGTIRTEVFYRYEFLPAQMLAQHTDSANVRIVAPALGYVPYVPYMPNAQYVGTPPEFTLVDESGVLAYLTNQAKDFVGNKDESRSFYVDSPRPRVYYRHNFGVSLSDPRWDSILNTVRERSAVYHNGFITLYEATGSNL